MPSKVSQKPHVLILGAGLGGMTLAQALRKQGITFEIFERDESLHSRFPGWCIFLHRVVKDLELSFPDDLPPIKVTSHLQPLDLPAEACVYDHGEKVSYKSTDEKRSVRAHRHRLRGWLSTNLNVQFGKRLTRIEERDSSVTLHFQDGTLATGDILVGADVRKHLVPAQEHLLAPVPVGFIIGEVTMNKEQYTRQLDLAHSAWVVDGEGSRAMTMLHYVEPDANSARYYWMVWWPDEAAIQEPYWTASASKEKMHAFAMEKIKSLDPKFRESFELTPVEGILAPPIVLRDILLRSLPNDRRITLLGDAAHTMAPFRGEGGDHALRDAINLSRALANSTNDDLVKHLRGYQDEMLARTTPSVILSRAAALDDCSATRKAMEGWFEHPQASL
ncbi:MAG: hypothetical protein M1820_010667 [Bogoriella megaspora]|nr:MAG: hypothetical protein M1820_010667 [Bogoriella megaspora]